MNSSTAIADPVQKTNADRGLRLGLGIIGDNSPGELRAEVADVPAQKRMYNS
jgi:hypothetical protein